MPKHIWLTVWPHVGFWVGNLHLLRRQLFAFLQPNRQLSHHPKKLARLRRWFHHGILPYPSEFPEQRYTCVPFALGLVHLPAYWAWSRQYAYRRQAGTDFVEFLQLAQILSWRERPQQGDVAVYFDAYGRVQHVGKVLAVKPEIQILSKWGSGLLYQHPPLEAPFVYGDVVRYAAPLEPELLWVLFEAFLTSLEKLNAQSRVFSPK